MKPKIVPVNVEAFANAFAAHLGASVLEADSWRGLVCRPEWGRDRLLFHRNWNDQHHISATMTLDPDRSKWWTGAPTPMPTARFDARRGLAEIARDLARRVIDPSLPLLAQWRETCESCERQHQAIHDLAQQLRDDGATVRLEIHRFDTMGRLYITGPHGTICATAGHGSLTFDRLSLPVDLARRMVDTFIS